MFILCLDTDQYAGNFERETTAYATGVIGECGVGEDLVSDFEEEVDFEVAEGLQNKIAQREDRGCSRPCAIQPTPGWVNDGLGNCYRQSDEIPPTAEQQAVWIESATDMKIKPPVPTSWWPCYYTVGIFFHTQPTQDEIDLIVKRAGDYLSQSGRFHKPTVLERVRLIEVLQVTREHVRQSLLAPDV